jgi:A/G-specific adenine glycosylase
MPTPRAIHVRLPLLSWYDRHKRDLPWRSTTGLPPAYHVLLSEFMLQQTQVATVIDYFHRFLQTLPTIRDLAGADEQTVLRLWQGLGYYSRARNLHKCAKAIVEQFAGEIPRDVDALLTLPGVGPYTAGAIASLAYDVRAPIVDGNVIRVICRLDGIEQDPRDKTVLQSIWKRAGELVPEDRPGDFNSALMELGATVCTPRAAKCLLCPLREHCVAQKKGLVESIPPVKKTKATPIEKRIVYCLARTRAGKVEFQFEQRPATGRWASMWQFITRADPLAGESESIGSITHQLTHRKYEFDVRLSKSIRTKVDDCKWLTLDATETLPLPKPHVQIRQMLRARF